MTIVHLEPEEFVRLLFTNQKQSTAHVIVLDNCAAAIIYTCKCGEYLYYMDRVEVSGPKQTDMLEFDAEELHAQVYRKMALDARYCQA